MKALRRIFFGILLLPVLLVGLFILYELFGMAVNHAASARQTEELVRLLERELPQAEIIGQYTETGNTTETGNHVDMLTAVILRTDAGLPELERLLDQNYGLDGWSCWAKELEEITAYQEEYPGFFPWLTEMEIPDELDSVYLLYRNTSAPFVWNIEGH